jgi:hypothetical protein
MLERSAGVALITPLMPSVSPQIQVAPEPVLLVLLLEFFASNILNMPKDWYLQLPEGIGTNLKLLNFHCLSANHALSKKAKRGWELIHRKLLLQSLQRKQLVHQGKEHLFAALGLMVFNINGLSSRASTETIRQT